MYSRHETFYNLIIAGNLKDDLLKQSAIPANEEDENKALADACRWADEHQDEFKKIIRKHRNDYKNDLPEEIGLYDAFFLYDAFEDHHPEVEKILLQEAGYQEELNAIQILRNSPVIKQENVENVYATLVEQAFEHTKFAVELDAVEDIPDDWADIIIL